MQNGYFQSILVDYSNHIYNQLQLFTILAMKTYLKTTYCEIIEFLEVSDKNNQIFKAYKTTTLHNNPENSL